MADVIKPIVCCCGNRLPEDGRKRTYVLVVRPCRCEEPGRARLYVNPNRVLNSCRIGWDEFENRCIDEAQTGQRLVRERAKERAKRGVRIIGDTAAIGSYR